MFLRTAILVLLFSSIMVQVYCGAYWEHLETKRIGRNRIMEYCETHEENENKEKMLLFKGSKVKFKDSCFVCKCNKEGLDCETQFGLILGGYASCKLVIDDCKLFLVDEDDDRLRCISRLPTNKKVPKKYQSQKTFSSLFG